MKTRLLSSLALALAPIAAWADGNLEVYSTNDQVLKSVLFADIESVKFADERMSINLRPAGAPAESPFSVATADVSRVKFKIDWAAVDRLDAEPQDAPAQFFTLQGIRIQNPEKGTPCIRIQGNKATKIIF